MTPRQRDELVSVPLWLAGKVRSAMTDPERTRQLLDAYEERVAIICEGREPTDEDFAAAWKSTIGIRD